MSENKLNLSDLEIENLDVTTETEAAVIEAFSTGGEGHGMTEVGASCNSCCNGCPGSVQDEVGT
jgi:hypothetical protein